MSEAEEHDSVRVSADGIRVLKRFAADQFPVPAIAFDISSGRDEQVTFRLSDKVPEDVAVDDLGFHPDYGSEYWTIEEDRITFERDLDADESYTTVYGTRAADDVSQFLTEPTIEMVDPPLPETDEEGGIVLESDDALVEDALSGGFGSPDPEPEESTDEPEIPSTLDLGSSGVADTEETGKATSDADTADAVADTADAAADTADATADTADATADTADTADAAADTPDAAADTADATADTADTPDAAADTPDAAADTADATADTADATADTADATADTADTADAATDTPDAAADTADTADAVADSTSSSRPAVEPATEGSLVATLATELRENNVPQEDIDMLREVLVETEKDSGSTTARLDRLQQDVADLRAYTSAIEEFLDENGTGAELIDSFEEQLDEFEDELTAFGDRIEHLETEFVIEVRGRLDDIESDLDRLDDIESDLDRLDDIESDLDRLDDIEQELEEIQAWRNQLINTLGG